MAVNLAMLSALSAFPSILKRRTATREAIQQYQNRRLNEIVTHAYHHVPYYRRLFDGAGVKPADIRSKADLHHIPVTTKAALRARPAEDLISENVKRSRLQRYETNGSTGVPLTVYRTRAEGLQTLAFGWRGAKELGIGRGVRLASINWGSPKGIRRRGNRRERRSLLNRIAGVESWTRVDCMLDPEEMAAQLRDAKPDFMSGYAGVLSRLADHLSPDQTDIEPRLVISVSEVLTPAMRARIEQVFHAPVRDAYAAWELGLIAYECRLGGTYHVCDDALIMEVMSDGRDAISGESGDVVATSLRFSAMPLIRYELGDVVTRGPEFCACGSPFTTLSAVQGRMVDYFRLPDGRVMHPYEISKIIWETAFRLIARYQMVQESLTRIVARVMLRADADRAEVDAIFEKVRPLLGPEVEFVIEYVDDIPPGPKGKFGVYRSLLSSEYK
jgi:phenylacetate-CoA ligase